MTDNRTTELRAKLTERGVEYTTNDHMGVYETSLNGFTAMQLTPGAKLIMTVTPEQAIAATLGRPTFNANLEQALSFMRIWISDDAHLGESELSYEFEKAEGLRKLDAIESAIAATLGSERERRLELLVKHLWYLVNHRSGYGYAAALEAIEELGIEVDE